MTGFPIPIDEAERLWDLHRLELLDTPADPCFERIVNLASEALQMPVALVSLVDTNRQWFLARHGLDAQQTSRQVAFCAHTVAAEDLVVIPDTLDDPRFRDNPLVTGDTRFRFYAGAPLYSPEGHVLGTLCVLDQKPRQLDRKQLNLLQQLVDVVRRELFLRRQMTLCQLTGTFQCGSFLRIAASDLVRARAAGFQLACLNVEIVGFRQVNNCWGYQEGDRLLRTVASQLRELLQPRDLSGRLGDSDFALLLLDRDADQAAWEARGRRGKRIVKLMGF